MRRSNEVAEAETEEVLGSMGAWGAQGWVGEPNVEPLADWPCSYVCVRGRRGSKLAAASTGRPPGKLSQRMWGIVLRVSDGVCRGMTTSAVAAREPTKKLGDRSSEIRVNQYVVRVLPRVVSKPKGRRGSSTVDELEERTGAIMVMDGETTKGQDAKEEVHISGMLRPSPRPRVRWRL
eukprot:g2050.t1